MLKKAIGICGAVCALTGCGGSADPANEATGQASEELVRGTPVPISDVPSIGRPYVVLVLFQTGDGFFQFCSGSYFAPRVVLTAAHCIPPQFVARTSVYFGTNLEADIDQVFDIPPPGQPSAWAKADSWQAHPDFARNPYDADLAVVYLDRNLPFDPLPLFRNRLNASWTNRVATLVGWGANRALSEDTSENEGFGTKRTGTARIIGTPTLADYDPEPSEVPLLTPTVRSHNIKLNGRAPNVNLCSGDSGGPFIVNQFGQDYVAGVASRTGAWCENLSLFTRIDPYLPFLDEAYRRGGQAPLIPSLDCVDTRVNGKLAAYFGYNNENGVSVSVPHGARNQLALDASNERPALFHPGNNRFAVGIDFNPGQTVTWRLSPPNSPTTEVRATSASPRCEDTKGRRCARYCEAELASECIDEFFDATWDSCITACLDGYRQFENECEDEWGSFLACVAATPPARENWFCETPFFDPLPPAPACSPLVTAALDCLSGARP
jgi:hypothetical protein